MDVYPIEFECLDHDDPIFKVKAFDGKYAEIKIDTPINVALWDQIAPLIRDCLVQMKLED